MAKKFAYVTMAVIVLIYIEQKINLFAPRVCKFIIEPDHLTISTITFDTFIETIPQTGNVTDSSHLVVEIDKLYRAKIKNGLLATADINNAEIRFRISHIDTTLIDGRFSVRMDLSDTSINLTNGKSVRLRIQLTEPREAILIPVGGFYKDTGGEWVYVTTDEKHFERRDIKLGPKNPNYFVVLEGLRPGEKVLTSSYENFPNRNDVSLWEIKRKRPVSLM